MNKFILLLALFSLTNSFIPSFKKNNNFKLQENKQLDLFDKFEKYSLEKNEEMQDEYLFKIHEYLSIKRNLDELEKAVLEEHEEKKEFFLNRINKFLFKR